MLRMQFPCCGLLSPLHGAASSIFQTDVLWVPSTRHTHRACYAASFAFLAPLPPHPYPVRREGKVPELELALRHHSSSSWLWHSLCRLLFFTHQCHDQALNTAKVLLTCD
jgi:hypothetical protein